jgi:hypothetical protein
MRHEYPQPDRLKSAHFIGKLLQARNTLAISTAPANDASASEALI